MTAAPATDRLTATHRFTAMVRRPAPALAGQCELTFLERAAMSFARLEHQHAAYRDALAAAGADVTYRELDDLSHCYPSEMNAPILRWLSAEP